MTAALITAWQAALAAEHQAVFGYGLLGPQLTGDDLELAITCSNEHETLRNQVESTMSDAGIAPVQVRADYPALYPVRSAAAARHLAVRLEDDCAAAWRSLFAVVASDADSDSGSGAAALRPAALCPAAQRALTASAVRATRWRRGTGSAAPTVAFPGIAT